MPVHPRDNMSSRDVPGTESSPPRIVSNPFEPVVMCTNSDRLEWISVAVVNPMGTILHATMDAGRGYQVKAARGENVPSA